MFQVLIKSVLYLSFIFDDFYAYLSSKMNLELCLFLLAHCCFNESQNYEKVSSGASKGMKLVLKGDFKFTAVVLEQPPSSDGNELFMGVICASFKFLLFSRLGHVLNFLLLTFFT